MVTTLTALATLALSQSAGIATSLPELAPRGGPVMEVHVDSATNVVVISAGLFHLPETVEHGHDYTQMMRFEWPVEGWMRGFTIKLTEPDGTPIPQSILHHFVAVNFERRQLVYPVVERLFAVGQETSPVLLPEMVGVPLDLGTQLGMYAMWINTQNRELDVHLEVRIPYLPSDRKPMIEVLPLYVDVNNVIGEISDYDVMPGVSTRSWEFETATSGRLIMAGGHLHTFGKFLRLENAETGEVVVQLNADADEDGNVYDIERKILGVPGQGVRLEAGQRYRLVAQYDNLGTLTIKEGAMAHLMGIFAPDDMTDWPAIDETLDIFQLDMAGLQFPRGEMRPTDPTGPDGQERD